MVKNGPEWQNYVCHTSYLKKHTSYDPDFWYTCVKLWYLQQVFSFFKNSDFGGFLGVKRVKNEPKSLISVCHTPYLSNCRSDHCWIKTSVMCVFFVLQKWHLKLNILNILSSHNSTQMDLSLFWKKFRKMIPPKLPSFNECKAFINGHQVLF